MNKISRVLATGLLLAALPFAAAQAATYTAQEKANIKLVEDFYQALDKGDANADLKRRIRGIAEKYLAPGYIQHGEEAGRFGAGREGFIRFFESMPGAPAGAPAGAKPGPAAPPSRTLALMADGDLVIRVNARSMPAPGAATASSSVVFNMFRIQDGKLAEHWDSLGSGMNAPPAASARPGARAPGTP